VWGIAVGTATAGIVWAVVGDLSEDIETRYADYLWRPSPILAGHRRLIGFIGAGVATAAIVALRRAGQQGRLPWWRGLQIGALAGFGAWLGLSYRALTAGVIGANIGGGLVWFATPVIAVALIITLATFEVVGRRR